MEKKYYTPEEVAELTGKSIHTVRRWCQKGMINNLVKTPGNGNLIPVNFLEPVDDSDE